MWPERLKSPCESSVWWSAVCNAHLHQHYLLIPYKNRPRPSQIPNPRTRKLTNALFHLPDHKQNTPCLSLLTSDNLLPDTSYPRHTSTFPLFVKSHIVPWFKPQCRESKGVQGLFAKEFASNEHQVRYTFELPSRTVWRKNKRRRRRDWLKQI